MAAQYPDAVEELIGELKRLPGIGRRGAERIALAMLDWPPERIEGLGKLLAATPRTIQPCPECGALAEAGKKCKICADPARDRSLLCVVESMAQLFAVEAGNHYRGLYLLLGGHLSPLDAETGSGLNIAALKARAFSGEVKEIIFALSSDVEGRATGVYLSELLDGAPAKISRLALGLPAGANLSYADSATIAAAFSGRVEL